MSVAGYRKVVSIQTIASGASYVSDAVRVGTLSEVEGVRLRLTGTSPDVKVQYQPGSKGDDHTPAFPNDEAAFAGYDSITDSSLADRPGVASSEDMHFGGFGLAPAPYYRFRVENLSAFPVIVNMWIRTVDQEA